MFIYLDSLLCYKFNKRLPTFASFNYTKYSDNQTTTSQLFVLTCSALWIGTKHFLSF